MDASDLDQQIRIEYQATTTDATYGPQPGAWLELTTVWAKVEEILRPRPMDHGQELRMQARPVKVTMRYRDDVTSDMRLVMVDRNDRTLRITNGPAETGGRKRFIQVFAEEFSTEGDAA